MQCEQYAQLDEEFKTRKASNEQLQAELRTLKFGEKLEKYIGADQLLRLT